MYSQHGEKMSRDELQSILDDVDPEGTGKLDYAEVGVAELIFKGCMYWNDDCD